MASVISIDKKVNDYSRLIELVKSADSDRIILKDSSVNLADSELQVLSQASEQLEDNDIAFLNCSGELSQDDLSSLDASSMLDMIVRRGSLQLAAIAASKSNLISTLINPSENFHEASMKMFAKAIVSGANITSAGQTKSSGSSAQLSNEAYSRILSIMANSMTIEELFPQHAWKEHSEESAAAAYHTLAAYFIRFEDYASAAECLKLSEQFEESPRALALRALIAFNKGETLGAVANLVSSLQQYEERKKSTTHYIKFSPQNIELINSSLVSGLEALNKRDNEKAIDHFAKAVFSFDTFYSQLGLEDILH